MAGSRWCISRRRLSSSSTANKAYQDWAVAIGLCDKPAPYVFSIYSEPMRKFQLAAEGHGTRQPPEHMRARIRQAFAPLPTWYPPFEGELIDKDEFPYHALTQRPAAMYHSWGSQNAWLRQIHGANPLYVPGNIMDDMGLADGGWAWVTSHHGKIKVPVRRTDAANGKTLWTWNAIGKRKGAWALSSGAPEVTKGFLLNHLIHELLPPKGDGLRWANSDPVTGQAAWYDLKVRIEPAEDGPLSPDIGAQTSPVGTGAQTLRDGPLRYGKEWTE
jgi:anaerobic selenocysteine-containing dehydrogenase